jgi:hypothetical protein
MLNAARSRVAEEILGTVKGISNSSWGVSRGTNNVWAMPPVARIPQRTIFGDDMLCVAVILLYQDQVLQLSVEQLGGSWNASVM